MRRPIFVLLILFAAGCGITDPNSAALSLHGTVTAEATGLPVSGAEVSLTDPAILYGVRASTTTDAQGNYSLAYSIDHCVSGALGITLSAVATGFAEKSTQPACASSPQRIDFSLAAAP